MKKLKCRCAVRKVLISFVNNYLLKWVKVVVSHTCQINLLRRTFMETPSQMRNLKTCPVIMVTSGLKVQLSLLILEFPRNLCILLSKGPPRIMQEVTMVVLEEIWCLSPVNLNSLHLLINLQMESSSFKQTKRTTVRRGKLQRLLYPQIHFVMAQSNLKIKVNMFFKININAFLFSLYFSCFQVSTRYNLPIVSLPIPLQISFQNLIHSCNIQEIIIAILT